MHKFVRQTPLAGFVARKGKEGLTNRNKGLFSRYPVK